MYKILLSVFLIFSINASANLNFYKDLSLKPLDIEEFGDELTKEIFSKPTWPKKLNFNNKDYKVSYTFNKKLTTYIKKELRRYGSDYASVVVIDNNTGKILSAIDHNRKGRTFGKNLTFSSTSPAASIFKVITASELIENSKVERNSIFSYSGKATTLYKYQLKDRKNRWTRKIPFQKAFAYSHNVVFGKAAIKNTNYVSLAKMANKFGFNRDLLQLVEAGNSKLFNKGEDYELAELASGFNRDTMISPVHGAVIASIIANGGLYRRPTVVDEVVDVNHDRRVWKPKYSIERILSKRTAENMQDMMELTVKRGTASSAFRPWKIKKIKNLDIGGKTGTITGGVPYGKRDWFVSYATTQDPKDKGISVCVMIVNVNKWYIKSTYLAKNVIQHYYSKIKDKVQ